METCLMIAVVLRGERGLVGVLEAVPDDDDVLQLPRTVLHLPGEEESGGGDVLVGEDLEGMEDVEALHVHHLRFRPWPYARYYRAIWKTDCFYKIWPSHLRCRVAPFLSYIG